MRDTVGCLGAHDIGKEVILQHGDSHIRGILQNITHDVEKITESSFMGEIYPYFDVTTTLDISGVIVCVTDPDTPINTVTVTD